MAMIPHNDHDGQMIYTVIENFLSMFHVEKLLRKAGADKKRYSGHENLPLCSWECFQFS